MHKFYCIKCDHLIHYENKDIKKLDVSDVAYDCDYYHLLKCPNCHYENIIDYD